MVIFLTITGSDIIENCRACFSMHGYGIRLNRKGDILVCSHDSTHTYALRDGMLEKVERKW